MTDASSAADRPWTRVGSYAVCVDVARRLLLTRLAGTEPHAGWWTLPGGGLEWGEHPADAVLRELEEETGLVGEVEELVDVLSFALQRSPERPRDSLHVIQILYRVRASGAELRVEQAGSTDMCAWLPRDEALALPLVPMAQAATRIAWGT